MLTLVQSLVLRQGGVRPVLIVQNDVGNRFSPTVIAAVPQVNDAKANFAHAYMLQAENTGLVRDSIVLWNKSEP